MRKIVPLLAILLLGACSGEDDFLATNSNPGPVIDTWQATLAGTTTRPTAGGSIKLTTYTTQFKAEGTFSGLLPNTQYHWKLYFGTCAARLAQVGPNAQPPAYPFFTTNATGAGSAAGTVIGRLRADSTYNMRVFTAATATAANDTVVYACGNVTKS
jgi:hypothetical protein